MSANRAILFDLDGTLVDSLQDIADSANRALATLGAPPHPTGDYRRMIGQGVEELIRSALPGTLRNPEGMARALAAMRDDYARNWNSTTRPFPGILESIAHLRARGVALGVLSNKPHAFTVEMVDTLFAPGTFDLVWGARPGVPHKPDPIAALDMATTLAVEPASCALVGDSDIDIHTARAAGMQPVGVLWGLRDEAELREAGAELLLARPEEIRGLG